MITVATSSRYISVTTDQTTVAPARPSQIPEWEDLQTIGEEFPNQNQKAMAFSIKNQASIGHNSKNKYEKVGKTGRTPHPQNLRKRDGKQWLPLFDTQRLCFDRSLYSSRKDSEAVQDNIDANRDEDILDTLLGELHSSIPSWEAKVVRTFISELYASASASTSSKFETWAWMDDREYGSGRSRPYPTGLNAQELCTVLRKERYNSPGLPNADRRLVYISKLTPAFILVLAETAWAHQVEAIRDMICKHISLETSFRVHIPRQGFATFRLEFHLAHLILRKPAACKNLDNNAGVHRSPVVDLNFLGVGDSTVENSLAYVYQAHISVVVCGWSSNQWTGYAIANTGLPEEEFEAQEEYGPKRDPFVADRSDDYVKDADAPEWDARRYWLQTVAIRCELILKEWIFLVRSVEEGIERWVSALSRLLRFS